MAPEHALFDFLKTEYNILSDRQLCAALGITPPMLSKIRHGVIGVSGDVIILIHEKTGMSIADIKELISENGKNNTLTSV
jgi:transcriptional regulator with XRE-family HTH domain